MSSDVRFTPESEHMQRNNQCPLCANNGHWPITSGQAATWLRAAEHPDLGELARLHIDLD
jgi:hypothetical protein